MNIREALFSAAAAFDAPVDRAGLPGLATLLSVSQRGATEETLMQAGFFKPADLLKAGCARADVAAACVSMPGAMRTAGLSAEELMAPDADAGLCHVHKEPGAAFGGWRGAAVLREAGYTADEVLGAGGGHSAWHLKQAGYGLEELRGAGVSVADLSAAGFAHPVHQPPSFLGATFRPLCAMDPDLLPPRGEGAQSAKWQALCGTQAQRSRG
ncbi:hypothetical protein FOA52_009049 [Chlamydomonas sp. UWO 241]|nr:hypothetical protein FOA52_009049 [Chlamydomonas sp. UWO 241]